MSTPETLPPEQPLSEGVLALGDLRLNLGDVLPGAKLAYRLVGPTGAPVVAVLGGISSHRFVSACSPRGWWKEIVAPGAGVDTGRYAVLGIDFLGGSGDSTSPAPGRPFPAVSPADQADALARVVDHLGIEPLHAIVGSSYGGMVALVFAQRHPRQVRRIVVFSAAHCASPLSTAWRCVQRQVVREALARGDGPAGLRIARALAMTTYRSRAEFAQRFSGPPRREGGRFWFPVEDYLFARGDHYAQNYRPESFLALSESIDLHEVDPAGIRVPATLIAVREDQLVPIEDMRALSQRLAGVTQWVELSSLYGHDAFLKEGAVINPIIGKVLEDISP
ncbi:MAG: homoserine O-succinyltransferase [Steroidobacteraceae bacterium]